jgi:hypothetical protein
VLLQVSCVRTPYGQLWQPLLLLLPLIGLLLILLLFLLLHYGSGCLHSSCCCCCWWVCFYVGACRCCEAGLSSGITIWVLTVCCVGGYDCAISSSFTSTGCCCSIVCCVSC